MLLHFLEGKPLFWVSHKDVSDEVLALDRHILPFGVVEAVLAPLDKLEQLKDILVEEGKMATEEDICHDSDAEAVTFLVVEFLVQNLWRNIAGSAARRARQLVIEAIIAQVLSDPEVCDLDT